MKQPKTQPPPNVKAPPLSPEEQERQDYIKQVGRELRQQYKGHHGCDRAGYD